jgi:hypothetical protein
MVAQLDSEFLRVLVRNLSVSGLSVSRSDGVQFRAPQEWRPIGRHRPSRCIRIQQHPFCRLPRV